MKMSSRVFKNYNNQITQKYKKGTHNGIDLVGYKYAVDYEVAHSDGVVVGVRKDYKTKDATGNSYGNYVKIKHNNEYYTLYAHIAYNTVTVNVGDNVTKGQVIGLMGNTGHSTGKHLHFEVRDKNDKKIDPTPYIDADLPDDKTEVIKYKVTAKSGLNIRVNAGVIYSKKLVSDIPVEYRTNLRYTKPSNYAVLKYDTEFVAKSITNNWALIDSVGYISLEYCKKI